MLLTAIKVVVTAVLVVAIAEIAKRSTLMGAVLASIPLTSVLAMIWLYADTGDAQKVADLAAGIFWLVLPSLALFIALPVMLRAGWPFAVSMGASLTVSGWPSPDIPSQDRSSFPIGVTRQSRFTRGCSRRSPRQAGKDRGVVATGRCEHEAVPDRILKTQRLPQMKERTQ